MCASRRTAQIIAELKDTLNTTFKPPLNEDKSDKRSTNDMFIEFQKQIRAISRLLTSECGFLYGYILDIFWK